MFYLYYFIILYHKIYYNRTELHSQPAGWEDVAHRFQRYQQIRIRVTDTALYTDIKTAYRLHNLRIKV